VSHTFPSLVLSEGEEEDDADHDAKDVPAAADDNDNNKEDNDGTSMPPKVKPVATQQQRLSRKEQRRQMRSLISLPPSCPKYPSLLPLTQRNRKNVFSIKAEDPLTVFYYATGKHDYAYVVIRVNITMEYGEYEVRVAEDGCLILFVRAICAKSFDKIIVRKIMKDNYHQGSTRVIAWDDTVQGKKVHPKDGLYWGMPQVVYLKWKCTGTPIAVNKLD
jgi:hypothetical protein